MSLNRLLARASSLALIAMLMPGDARAAEAAAEASSGPGLEDIIVTAQKRAENIQSVPITVTAFNAAEIENTQQKDLSDLSAAVPNFQISVGGSGPGASLISLRGLSFQDIERSFEPPIGLMVDGVYLSTSTGQVAQTFDFDKIEVSAGPQGTLFGKNTTGGVINITRTKPNPDDDGIGGKIRLTGGNFGEYDGEAVVTATAIPGVLAFKLAAFSQNNDGPYRDPFVSGGHVGKRDYQSFEFATDWRPNDKADVYFIFDHTSDHSQLAPQFSASTPNTLILPVGGGLLIDGRDALCLNPNLVGACVNGSGQNPNNTATSNNANDAGYILNALTLNLSYNFDSFKIYSITGYRYSTEESKNDYDATQYQLFETNRPESYRQTSEELRFESEFQGPFNFVGGAYYFNSGYTLVQHSFLDFAAVAPIPPGLPGENTYFGQYTHQTSSNEALFFQGNYDLNDQVRLIIGARQSWDQKRILFGLSSDPPNPDLDQFGTLGPITTLQHSWAQFTPKVSIEYKVNPDLMTYFTYSKGYNSGGFNGRAGSAAVLGPYAPEQVHSYELGVKSSWLDNRLRINADVFKMDFNNAQEDIIVAIPVAPYTGTTVENAAQIAYQGAELEVTGKPTPDWTVSTNVGLLDAKYTSFNAALLYANGEPLLTDNSNLKVRRTPPVTIGFNSDYRVPLETGELGFDVSVKYIAAQQFDLLNDPRGYQPEVTKLDAAVRYNIDVANASWTLQIFGKNLTNETPNNTFVTGYQGSFVEFWSQEVGRTYGATLDVKF